MRDRDTIDSELRRLAAVRRSIRERGGELSSRQVDELLDERLGHQAAPSEAEAANRPQCDETGAVTRSGRKDVLRRLGLLAALPLSLIAVVAGLVVMFTVHHSHPAAQPADVPPSATPPNPPQSGVRPSPAPPKAPAAVLDPVDRVFIEALNQEGVPVPSHEYVMAHAHAVCDFVAGQPSFAEAVRFVQQSSIWDADQSTEFAAGAIASYCPQHQAAGSDEMQQILQKVLSDLQAIHGDLQGIRDHLPAIPGRE